MSRAPEVFGATLTYARQAYKILGVKDPPPMGLLIHGICCKQDNPTVGELAELTGLSLKTTSRALRQIRCLGIIELRVDEVDTRQKHVCLTRKGREIERALYQNLVQFGRHLAALVT